MIRISILLIFFFSCRTEPIIQEIDVGKTIKIAPSNFSQIDNNDFNFLWSSPLGPVDSNPIYQIEKDKMLFTPDKEGNYEVTLTIESISHNSIYEETFLFNAKLTNTLATNQTKTSEKIVIDKNIIYTLQVAAWPTLEDARKQQIKLREDGFDAYTQQVYFKETDKLLIIKEQGVGDEILFMYQII